jgi:hypothetical protein
MKKIICTLLLLSNFSYAQTEGDLKSKALNGDYQAQRNLAYGYATGDQKIKKNHSLACSWYLLILRSDSPKINSSDIGNVATYCDPFKPDFGFDERLIAERQANELYRNIYLKR